MMIKIKTIFQILCLTGLGLLTSLGLLVACGDQQTRDSDTAGLDNEPDNAQAAEISLLREQLQTLQKRAQRIKDSNAIKRLQRVYGYYVDEALWDEVTDLFTEDATIEFALDGVYRGKPRIREYLYRLGGGQQGLKEGQLNEHLQLMPVVTLSEDGMTAKGRWRDIILAGQYGESATWGEGPYENEYVKEDGVWKISKLHWFQSIMVPYAGGWAENADINGGKYVSTVFPPDEPTTIEYETWPSTFLPPFHFPNPVATYLPQVAATEEGAKE